MPETRKIETASGTCIWFERIFSECCEQTDLPFTFDEALEEADRSDALQRMTRVLEKYKEAEAVGDDDGVGDVMVEIMFSFRHLPRYQKLIYDLFTVILMYQKAFALIRENENLRQVYNICDTAEEAIRESVERRGSRTPPDISKINMN